MKKLIPLAIIATLALGGCKGSAKIDTPEELMKAIQKLALAKDYQGLKNHIYPLFIVEKDVRAGIIDGIRNNLEFNDFAYSDAAMTEIIKSHLDKFKPLPKKLLDDMFLGRRGIKDPKLKQIARTNPQDIIFFEYGQDAHMILAKIDGELKLLFWEDITAVTRKK